MTQETKAKAIRLLDVLFFGALISGIGVTGVAMAAAALGAGDWAQAVATVAAGAGCMVAVGCGVASVVVNLLAR